MKTADNAEEIRICCRVLLFGSIILNPQWKRRNPNASPVSVRALMRQFLNKRKTPLRPSLEDLDVSVRPPGSRTHTLAQGSTLTPPSQTHRSVWGCCFTISDLWMCWQLSWQWSCSSRSHSDSYKQICPKITKRRKSISCFSTDRNPHRRPQC